jgi:hypothetical protein
MSEITLRALEGRPLADRVVREMVVATARAIAERQGVALLDVRAAPDHVTANLRAGRIEAIGFAAELRRLTTHWYTRKFGERTLWGEPPADEGEEWKRA